MTHLPYVITAYALGVGVPITFAINAIIRFRSARRRLAVIDVRPRR